MDDKTKADLRKELKEMAAEYTSIANDVGLTLPELLSIVEIRELIILNEKIKSA